LLYPCDIIYLIFIHILNDNLHFYHFNLLFQFTDFSSLNLSDEYQTYTLGIILCHKSKSNFL